MKRTLFYALCGLVMVGCSVDRSDERSIEIRSSVSDDQAKGRSQVQGKAVAINTSALSDVQFLRKDITNGDLAPTDFSNIITVLSGDRGTTGDITFATPKPRYLSTGERTYLWAFYPKATITPKTKASWAVDGKSDILVSTVHDAGTLASPLTGERSKGQTPMIFQHRLAQLEVTCQVASGESETAVQGNWGTINKVELLNTPSTLTLDFSTGVTTASGSASKVLLKDDYTTTAPATALTSAGTKWAGMYAPAAAGSTDPIQLKITTAKETAGRTISVQLKDLYGDNKGFEVGMTHSIVLSFKAKDKEIEIKGTVIKPWGTGYTDNPEVEVPDIP